MIYDVAIIGGGIAGLALSIDLKKRGYSIVVIEKGSYPRHKVCGEYISMESHNYLHNICPKLKDIKLPVINSFKLTSGKVNKFSTSLDLGGFGISRYLLEELLYKQALENNVVFMLDTKAQDSTFENEIYTIKTNNQTIYSKLVCNSSGRKSNLEVKERDQKPGETSYVGVKYHIKLNRNENKIEIHNFAGGYCGISNIEDGKACLCYIVNSKKLRSVNNSFEDLEKKVLFKNTALKKIFSEAEFVFKEPLTISSINFRIKKTVLEKYFLLGDSAGTIAPITGNGMSIGLRSASMLAETIDRYFSKEISKQQLTDIYTTFWNEQFSTRIKLSRYFQKLSEYSFLSKVTICIFNAFPALAKFIIKQTHGKPF